MNTVYIRVVEFLRSGAGFLRGSGAAAGPIFALPRKFDKKYQIYVQNKVQKRHFLLFGSLGSGSRSQKIKIRERSRSRKFLKTRGSGLHMFTYDNNFIT